MSLPLSSLITNLRERSLPQQSAFADWLYACVSDKTLLPRLLNMFSFMEHIGSRKIMLSQLKGSLPINTLKHLAEETRHAYFFKRQAERFAERSLQYNAADTIMPAAAAGYLLRLDQMVAHIAQPNWPDDTCYLLVSLLIELRAVWAYQLLEQALKQANVNISLKSLIAEEDLHLAEMAESGQKHMQDPAVMHFLLDAEQQLFDRLWQQLQKTEFSTAIAA